MDRKLTTIGFQRDQNFQILPCILRVINPASQHPKNQWSNIKLKGQKVMKFYELDIHEKLMKKGI